jgi:thiamine-monophosphate kinase
MSEFDLINRYFARAATPSASVVLGIGDDCALLHGSAHQQAISTDMLVEGRHFFADADPRLLGHKCLAVNLSDLAAMGARPIGFTLALSLPDSDEAWLQPFSEGLFALADQFDCTLIGGDTTKGPRVICITVLGEIEQGKSLRRDAAQVGDDIWVSGALGEARLALAHRNGEMTLNNQVLAAAALRMDAPLPRVALGRALTGIAHAAIDISDGLAGDLGHILERSQVGARCCLDALPVGPALLSQSLSIQQQFCATGGDDYELCFTAPASQRASVLDAAAKTGIAVTCIGIIEARLGLRWQHADGTLRDNALTSFDHFLTP